MDVKYRIGFLYLIFCIQMHCVISRTSSTVSIVNFMALDYSTAIAIVISAVSRGMLTARAQFIILSTICWTRFFLSLDNSLILLSRTGSLLLGQSGYGLSCSGLFNADILGVIFAVSMSTYLPLQFQSRVTLQKSPPVESIPHCNDL